MKGQNKITNETEHMSICRREHKDGKEEFRTIYIIDCIDFFNVHTRIDDFALNEFYHYFYSSTCSIELSVSNGIYQQPSL